MAEAEIVDIGGRIEKLVDRAIESSAMMADAEAGAGLPVGTVKCTVTIAQDEEVIF